uniref:Uncharacterized protein n=1 Tax=Triticum urartu TaxID=4572 RepID=A0A8R7K034_TRIUA
MASGFSFRLLSFSMSFSMFSLMAYLHARWQISMMSAPLNPCVYLASAFRSTSLATGDFLRQALKIWSLDSTSGRGM